MAVAVFDSRIINFMWLFISILPFSFCNVCCSNFFLKPNLVLFTTYPTLDEKVDFELQFDAQKFSIPKIQSSSSGLEAQEPILKNLTFDKPHYVIRGTLNPEAETWVSVSTEFKQGIPVGIFSAKGCNGCGVNEGKLITQSLTRNVKLGFFGDYPLWVAIMAGFIVFLMIIGFIFACWRNYHGNPEIKEKNHEPTVGLMERFPQTKYNNMPSMDADIGSGYKP